MRSATWGNRVTSQGKWLEQQSPAIDPRPAPPQQITCRPMRTDAQVARSPGTPMVLVYSPPTHSDVAWRGATTDTNVITIGSTLNVFVDRFPVGQMPRVIGMLAAISWIL